MKDVSLWLQSPSGQLFIELAGAALAFVLGRFLLPPLLEVLRKFWPEQKTAKYFVNVFFILIIISVVFWLFYPQSIVPKVATPGLVVLVLTTCYYYVQQIGKDYTVNTSGGKKSIRVRILKRTGLDPDKPLYISWDTIGKGAEYLAEQIDQYSPALHPDLILGVNELGMIIASYLAGTLRKGRKEIGFVRTGTSDAKTGKRPTFYSFPEILVNDNSQGLTILLVDNELKSGRSAKQIMAELKQKFKVNKIYLAVLTVCPVIGPFDNMTKIMVSKSEGKPVALPDFLAFFATGYVVPPGNIK